MATRHHPDDRVRAAKGQHNRQDAPEHVSPKAKSGDLGDQHVLRITNRCSGRPDVAGNRQRDKKRDGIDPPAKQRSGHHRREDKTDDVVVEKGRQTGRHQH
jgi:hypothetical protein